MNSGRVYHLSLFVILSWVYLKISHFELDLSEISSESDQNRRLFLRDVIQRTEMCFIHLVNWT